MNNFKKAALAGSVLSLLAISNQAGAVDLSTTTGNVIIGCAVPANSTAAATVYSIDSYDANAAINTGLPSWLKAGASCSRAVNWVLTGAVSGAGIDLVSATNQVASNGYTLQSFFFAPPANVGNGLPIIADAAAGGQPISMIGCAAPASGSAGATIYSVDGQNSSAGTANSGVTFTALSGNPCSSGLSTVTAYTGGGEVLTAFNARTADGAYSLQQYLVQ